MAVTSSAGDRKSQSDTRLLLIITAERQFALHGLAGTTLKSVHEASRLRNVSAINYHFGSKDGLLTAILNHRMPALNQRRMDRLSALDGKDPTLRELVDIWVEPLAAELRPRLEGNHYLRFLNHFHREAPPQFAAAVRDMQHGYPGLFSRITDRMANLPRALIPSRLAMAGEHIITSLAWLEGALPQPAKPTDFPHLAINNLVDYITGGLSVAPSPETIQAMGKGVAPADFHFHFLNADLFTPSSHGKDA